MNKIQNTSRYIRYLLNLMLILIPSFMLAQWFLLSLNDPNNFELIDSILSTSRIIQVSDHHVPLQTIIWTPPSLLLGVLSDIIQLAPFITGLFILRTIFKAYQAGSIFTLNNATSYKKLGYLFLVDAFITIPLSGSIMGLATTFNNEPGHRILSISFGTPNLNQIFYGFLIIVISWVMQEACKINDDQALTI